MNNKGQIIVCGSESLDEQAINAVKNCNTIYARSDRASVWLKNIGISSFIPLTFPFERKNLEASNKWMETISGLFKEDKSIAYVTPLHPTMIDLHVADLVNKFGMDRVVQFQGSSDLLAQLPAYIFENTGSLLTMDGLGLKDAYHPPFSTAQSVLIIDPLSGRTLPEITKLLSAQYPSDGEVWASSFKSDGAKWMKRTVGDLADYSMPVEALFIPSTGKERSLEGFQEIIARLRAPDGCPWDKKQTHSSLRPYLLEETYEALDALDHGDLKALQEELGDLVLQIALHARIAEENHEFQMGDILAGINKKIVFRHPHVFKDWHVDGENQVVQNWELLKSQERDEHGVENEKGLLDGVPASYPALAQAQAIQDRAARVGFDWKEIAPVLDKVREELVEIETAVTDDERAKEFGDLLFALVNLIRWKKIDAESVLRQTNVKFRKRFAYIEKTAKREGRQLQAMTLEEMDVLWELAKNFDD